MSGDFEIGDVVVCKHIKPRGGARDWHAASLRRLSVGAFYRVTAVGPCPATGSATLGLEGVFSDHSNGRWWAGRFRKIDAPRTEIADRIRACKPADHRVPA